MKNMKRLCALLMAVVMMMALSVTAFAANGEFQENNEEGVAGNWESADTERLQGDTIKLKKEIVAFNATSTSVHAPVVTYTYTVTPADVTNLTVTDEGKDHASNAAVTAPVKAGITTGLVVTGTAAGTAGTAASATGTLVFTNASTFTAAAAGSTNEYDITLDFSGVTFTQPGVYRYQIAETTSAAYAAVAMEDGEFDTVYLDVYVDGNLKIYGYVCMSTNASVDPNTDTKINGFVDGTAADGSDKYYTYDLVISKDVVNDSYAEGNIAFPFTVIFSNTEGYTSTFTITETAGTGSTGISPAAASAPTWSGVAKVKDGGAITYTGIPAGVDVEVYETNIAAGVTYTVDTVVNGGTAVNDPAVVWGTTPGSAVAQTTKADYESTKVTVDTTKIATVDAKQTVAITNTLLLISPTGVAMRVAPFVLMLAAGAVLLFFARRRRHEDEA